MSAPDDMVLSAEERAALASLEARAVADDPRLHDHLKSLRAARRFGAAAMPDFDWLTTGVARIWAQMHPMIWGPLLLVVGLAVTVLGVATTLVVGVIGVGLAGLGLALLVQAMTVKVEQARALRARLVAGSSD
jgi:hypothetical protein